MDRQRIESFDFMRSMTAFLIIIYHFANICNQTPAYSNFPFFYTHANGVWGENTSVNIFFMLSGASLYYNHKDVPPAQLRRFYFNRWNGIFPMFYMLWLWLYYQRSVLLGNLFFNGSPKTMLLSLFGMDGYLSYRYPQNYYFIGEWFLGALILLYLLYPLLARCMKRCRIFVTLLLAAGTLALHWPSALFRIPREHNLIVCLFAFWLGMLFIEYQTVLSKKWIALLSGSLALLLLFVKMPFDSFLCTQAIAVGLFFMLYHIGGFLMKYARIRSFFSYTASRSYAIFLLQHVTVAQVLNLFPNYPLAVWQECLLLLASFALICLFAEAAVQLNRAVRGSRWFGRLTQLLG